MKRCFILEWFQHNRTLTFIYKYRKADKSSLQASTENSYKRALFHRSVKNVQVVTP